MNLRPSGYEPDELPGCSTPHQVVRLGVCATEPAPRQEQNGVGFLLSSRDRTRSAPPDRVTRDPPILYIIGAHASCGGSERDGAAAVASVLATTMTPYPDVPAGGDKERVLVADDSPQNRTIAIGHLQNAGYQVIAVGSGEEALEVLARETIDLVVLDVVMPGIGGFETCRRIRATPAIAHLPVLFLTAMGDREATGPALETGADDLLPKPIQRAELILRARALIRQRKTTAKLEETLRALAEQNETRRRLEVDKRKMSQLIVHDLRGPLGAVMANAELARQTARGEQAEMLDDMLVAIRQLDQTSRDLLDLSRAEDGELSARFERFSMPELAAEVASTMRGMARWTGIEFDVAVATGTDRVVADRELTRRMLQNLVHNAVKHAPHGTAVRIEAGLDCEGLVLRVVDDGPGVPPDEVERIFERYVTLDDDPARSGSHGLGLAFCRLAAEAQGGRIWVEERGSGASFCVRIPQPVA